VKHSHPEWLVSTWIHQYGIETTEKICETNLKRPKVTARVNIRKTNRTDLISMLKKEGVIAEESQLSMDGIVIQEGNLVQTGAFQQGLVTIQDESSMLVGRAVNPQKGETILDCCAAPGGKTTHLAELMNCEGKIVALDVHEHKLSLIQQQLERLHLSNVSLYVLDARHARSKFSDESFDRILVDAPCTGFGVIRRKPDIKWKKTGQDVIEMSRIQLEILEAVSPLLKKGGTLIYSTCTLDKRENEQLIETFLSKHEDFVRDEALSERLPKILLPYMEKKRGEIQILPQYFSSDGFFIAAIRKKVGKIG
jgi:16S rRNA (cytosine967-C5)-methyltransferase